MAAEDKLNAVEEELKNLKIAHEMLIRERDILAAQLEMKDRHLQIILQNSTLVLSAFSLNGILELNTGSGMDIPNTNADQYKSAYLGANLDQLEKYMPHVVQAVRVSFEKNIITYGQSMTPSGKIFHVTFVPYSNAEGQVEYVYSLALRWPTADEIDEKHFYKGYLNLPIV